LTAIACALLWPATKPTARSFAAVGVTLPALAVVPVLALPATPSSGFAAATPENSCTFNATVVAPVVTVTLFTDAAFAANHISPSEFCPETANAPTLVHVFLPSLTAVIGLLKPVKTLAESTRRSPAVLGVPSVTVVVDDPADCTRLAPLPGAGVVTLTGRLNAEGFAALSRARTLYW
jgi:hypothetical protein